MKKNDYGGCGMRIIIFSSEICLVDIFLSRKTSVRCMRS